MRLLDTAHFAPLYRCGDTESHSPLALIRQKGCININPLSEAFWNAPDRHYCPPGFFIDADIQRVKETLPWPEDLTVYDPITFVSALKTALIRDAEAVENSAPGWTNIILCGGKDSLNLLLLPWRNPVLAASASPNYDLVADFIRKHHLDCNLIELEDEYEADLDREILVNCCRNDLAHCRWGGHLGAIARQHGSQAVIWLGQIGSALLTPYWRKYRYCSPPHGRTLRSSFSTRPEDWPTIVQRVRNKFGNPERIRREAMWNRAAHWQGAHMGIMHELTGVPVLSAYHGPMVTALFARTQFSRAVGFDLRPTLGEALFDGPVVYPESNPSPPPSRIRRGLSSVATFIDVLKRTYDVEIVKR